MRTTDQETSKTNLKSNNAAVTTGLVSAIAASSCCIPPVFAAFAGIGGISSGFSWMEPFRPYLIGLTVIAISYAWYTILKSKQTDGCACPIDKIPKWYQTKTFLLGVTIFSAVAVAFPYYSGIFFVSSPPKNTAVAEENNIVEAQFLLEGMTCTGCEHHVNQVLRDYIGVLEATASYEKGQVTVAFDTSKVSLDQLVKAVETKTGYKVPGKE